ncbi:thioesterase family protein [Roseibium sp. MMSF_3544]|uniref:acyl-CoA thioesterase n=1 Tax=unclassified Roseibium TaxID=2629323 RepID=UPI00273DCCE1|nr:thioesterase family protein [Roseibium sp. MMSF_3544]
MAHQTPLHRNDFPVLMNVQTRWSDNDVYGHLNNTVHYKLFDTVLNLWLIENRLLDPAHSDVIALVVETGCTFFAELAYPQQIVAGMRTERIGRTSITYRFALFGKADQAAAQGYLTHVLVDRASRKPRAIPEPWAAALQTIQRLETKSGSDGTWAGDRIHDT